MPTNDIEVLKWITMAYFSGTFILAIFNLNLFLLHKKKHLRRWLESWLTISVGYVILFISLELEVNFLLGIFALFMIGSSYLFLSASSLFLQFKFPKYVTYLLPISAIFILLFTIIDQYVAWSVLIGYLVNGYLFFVVGYQFLKKNVFLSRITGYMICLFSLVSFSYPFLSLQAWFSPWGYMAFGMLGLMVGMLLVQIHFHNQRHEMIKINQRLNYLVNHDTLTDVYNRSFINHTFEQINNEKITDIGLLFIDLNNFKKVNDQYGHRKGDDILIKVTSQLKEIVNERSYVCRFGGDEFVIIIHQTNPKEITKLKDTITNISHQTLLDDIKIEFAVGASFKESSSQDIHELLDVAEQEMYTHKKNQKNNR